MASGGRYGLLLLVLIVSYLLSAFNTTKLASDLQIGLFVTVLVLALRTSPLPGRWPVVIAVVAVGSEVAEFEVPERPARLHEAAPRARTRASALCATGRTWRDRRRQFLRFWASVSA